MYTTRQIWQHVTPKAQVLIALSLATVLAYSAGLASGIYGRSTQTADRNAVAAVAQPHQAAAAVPQRPAVTAPVAGAGSAYDGSHYGSTVSAPQTAPNAPAIGTGSAYDGGHNGSSIPAPLTSPNVPVSGTGSAYDGQ